MSETCDCHTKKYTIDGIEYAATVNFRLKIIHIASSDKVILEKSSLNLYDNFDGNMESFIRSHIK